MIRPFDRRTFLAAGAAVVAAPLFSRAQNSRDPLFKISLAQWSMNKAFFGRPGVEKRDPLDFAKIAKNEFGIEAIEYVNQFYKAKKNDDAYLAELKKVADGNGVRSVLIMCDGEGNLGDGDDAKRKKAVENHHRWLEWAKALGCHSIRVNAATTGGTREEAADKAADGLRQLSEFAAKTDLNVIVENHGGLSSDGEWLAGVMKKVNLKNCGTLPDFGNFNIGGGKPPYDKYKGVDELMPFAKGASAKTYAFNDKGDETTIDYRKMMEIVVKKHNFHGFVGIEYEGSKLSEPDGIRATKKLLETIRDEMSKS